MPSQGPLALDTPTWNPAYPEPNTLKSPNLLLYIPYLYLGTVHAVCQARGLGSPRHLAPGSFEDMAGSAAPTCSWAPESVLLAPASAPWWSQEAASLWSAPPERPPHPAKAPPWGPPRSAVQTPRASDLPALLEASPWASGSPLLSGWSKSSTGFAAKGSEAPDAPLLTRSPCACRCDVRSLPEFSCLCRILSTENHDALICRKTSEQSKRLTSSRGRTKRFARGGFNCGNPEVPPWLHGGKLRGQPTRRRAHSKGWTAATRPNEREHVNALWQASENAENSKKKSLGTLTVWCQPFPFARVRIRRRLDVPS